MIRYPSIAKDLTTADCSTRGRSYLSSLECKACATKAAVNRWVGLDSAPDRFDHEPD